MKKYLICLLICVMAVCCLAFTGCRKTTTAPAEVRSVKVYNATTEEVYFECVGEDFDFYEYQNGYEIYIINEDGSYTYHWVSAGPNVICEATDNAYSED